MFDKIARASIALTNWLPVPVINFLYRKNIHRVRWVRFGPVILTEVTIFGIYIADLPRKRDE